MLQYCHRRPVEYISMHPKQHFAITTSQSEAIFWNMEDWSKRRVLNHVTEGVGLRHASFSPSGDHIITSFLNETICIWSNSSFDLQWRLQAPCFTRPVTLSFDRIYDDACRVFAISKSEKAIIVGGKVTLYMWDFEKKELLRNLSIQSMAGGEITRLEIINEDSDLLVLTSDGRLLLVDIFQPESEIHLLNVERPVKLFEVSPDGKFLVTNAVDERAVLRIWDLEVLISDTMQHHYKDYSSRKLVQNSSDTSKSHEDEDILGKGQQNTQIIVDKESTSSPRNDLKEDQPQVPRTLRDQVPPRDASVSSVDAESIQNLSSESREERRAKLVEKLNRDGKYSEKHRVRAWRILLNLPENRTAYERLLKTDLDPAVKELISKKWPSLNVRISSKLEQFLAALIKLGFNQVMTGEWVSTIIYPFVEFLLDFNDVLAFELILTVLLNWYQHCWDNFPQPPADYLNIIANLLEHWDQSLFEHFNQCGANLGKDCLWPIILTSISSVFERDEWLQMWDHLFSNDEPSFLHYFVLAYVIILRDSILQSSRKKIKELFKSPQQVNLMHVIETAHKMEQDKSAPLWLSPRFEISRFKSLAKTGEYRLSRGDKNPKLKNQRDEIRDWIWAQEVEIIKKKLSLGGKYLGRTEMYNKILNV